MRSAPDSAAAEAATIARILASRRRALGAAREIRVRFISRADLGIAWRTVSEDVTVTPAQWRTAALPQAPAAPEVPAPRATARRAGTSPGERAQGAASIEIARPMLEALKKHWDEHLDAPDAGTLDTNPALRTIDERGVRVTTGRSGSIDVQFVSGPLASFSYSWIPIREGRGTQWVCAHPNIPAEDLGKECK